jgi:hypothetical protein
MTIIIQASDAPVATEDPAPQTQNPKVGIVIKSNFGLEIAYNI